MKWFVIILTMIAGCLPTFAHNAPTGWSYPMNCCSGVDCREVKSSWVKELPTGYEIIKTHELILFHDKRLKDSPDGEYHWCSTQGHDDGRTICLFIPPSSY
jgi:hypothetical protein